MATAAARVLAALEAIRDGTVNPAVATRVADAFVTVYPAQLPEGVTPDTATTPQKAALVMAVFREFVKQVLKKAEAEAAAEAAAQAAREAVDAEVDLGT